MKKAIAVLILLLTIVSGGAYWWIATLEQTIEEKLSEVFQTPVHIDQVTVSWNHMVISGFSVEDREEGGNRPIFEAERIDLDFDLWKALKERMWIMEKMEIQDPKMRLVMYSKDGRESNWSRMLDRADQHESTSSRGYLIRKVIIENTHLIATGGPLSGRVVNSELDPIHLENIGSHEPLPVDKVARVVSRALMDRSMIFLEFLKVIPKTLLQEVLIPFGMFGPNAIPVKVASKVILYNIL